MSVERKRWVIGTRKSKLAMAQAEHVRRLLQSRFVDHEFSLLSMSTIGDKVLDVALSKIGEKSLFTKELEFALEAKQCDFVVHSLKDLPTNLPPGMLISSILEREVPNDVLVISKKHADKGWLSLEDMPPDASIGTSSVRRRAQLLAERPGLRIRDVRGNLNTRLAKLDDPNNDFDALVLAYAGLSRLELAERISSVLGDEQMLHAVGQGALAIECRSDDAGAVALTESLSHASTTLCCLAERAFMRQLEGGCSVPLGTVSSLDGEGNLSLTGLVVSLDGKRSLKLSKSVNLSLEGQESKRLAEKLGTDLANALIDSGAKVLLQDARAQV